MNAASYIEALRKLGLPANVRAMHGEAAALFGVHARQSFRWASGETPVPLVVARLLFMLARHGIPDEWRPNSAVPRR